MIAARHDGERSDFQGETFDKQKDPPSLYNWRTYGHYTPEGYRLIGEQLARESRP